MVAPEPNQPQAAGAKAGRDFLIRSEERLDVHTERVPSGWVRLEKYLVTEIKTMTVELTHEEVRLVHERVDPENPHALSAPGGKNVARWMHINREELVVTKRVVPVERVRLEVYEVTEQQQITDTVRQENITDEPTLTAKNITDVRHHQS